MFANVTLLEATNKDIMIHLDSLYYITEQWGGR